MLSVDRARDGAESLIIGVNIVREGEEGEKGPFLGRWSVFKFHTCSGGAQVVGFKSFGYFGRLAKI